MAQTPPDNNFYYPHHHHHHHPNHHHHHPHQHHVAAQMQFRTPFDMLFDERTGALNYNYIRPYMATHPIPKPVMRRPRRSRTTFTSGQVAELEQHFAQGRYLTAARLAELSAKLQLGTAQVKIWFKNRRRRCKILSDQQQQQNNEHRATTTCDDMPPSPSMASQKSEASVVSNAENMPGVANLSVLTPSPTPTSSATVQTTQHYNHGASDAYNQFYYGHQRGTMAAHAPYNAPNALFTNQQQQQHQHHQQLLLPQQQQQQQQHHHQQHSSYYGNLKQEPIDFNNFSNPYYLGKTAAAAVPSVPAPMSDRSSATTNETYEPLTPKHEDIRSHETLQPKKTAYGDMFNSGVYHKQDKPTNDMHDVNYQCTMDTLMHAYNNHRNTNNNAHFATYCFN